MEFYTVYLNFISWIAQVLSLKHDFVVKKSILALNYFIHIFVKSKKSVLVACKEFKICFNKSILHVTSRNKPDNLDLETIQNIKF